jgi:dihydroorotase/N-acyl-D-amino-acid deacylase
MVDRIDVLIRGARVVDGTGNPWRYGDVALAGERILDVTRPDRIDAAQAKDVVDATNMVVCPGFIDIQSHSIAPLMVDPTCLSKITQGVTTEVMGEVWTPAPFGGRRDDPVPRSYMHLPLDEWVARARGWTRFRDWLEAMVARGVSPNIGSFLGGGSLRQYAKGMDDTPPTADELATMRRVVEESMADGAFGVSYALIYPPEAYVRTDEIVEICKVAAHHGGLYITHLRSEGDRFLEAIEEALQIGQRAGLPVEIYHLKAIRPGNWPKMADAIARIERARAEGIDVTADMYPYVASGTGLDSILPTWVAAGGGFFRKLRDPEVRARIHRDVEDSPGDRAVPEIVMPIGFRKPEHQQYVGRRLTEIAAMRGQHWLDAAIDLLAAEEQRVATIFFLMSEENVRHQLGLPWVKVSTDAGGLDPARAASFGPTHPRAYGTYPRVLGRYVRDERALALEDAVRKMSSAVADRLGIRDRGLLRPGAYADVVVFDPATIADRATFEQPHQLSVGIRDVWVNGTRVLANAEHTGATSGKIVAPGR